MRRTVRKEIQEAVAAYEDKPRDQWLFDYPAQVLYLNRMGGRNTIVMVYTVVVFPSCFTGRADGQSGVVGHRCQHCL